jgi:hypothetical protein
MSNFNKNLNVFAEKLAKFHISNQPTVHKIATAANSPRKTAKKATRTSYLRKNTAKQRGKTIKSKKQSNLEKRRRNTYARTLKERKEAATAKARTSRIQKKAEEEEKSKTLMVEGRTRGQTKALGKNSEMK